MSLPSLTFNCLKEMVSGMDLMNPVVQIIQIKRMNSDNDVARFKLGLTDGPTMLIGMASSASAEKIVPYGSVDNLSIVKLTNYRFNTLNDKKVLIIIDFDLMMPGNKVGRSLFENPNKDAADTSGQVSATRPAASGTSYGASAAVPSMPSAFKNVVPIESLTPYQNKWCIKARVTDKKPIKNWSNARGEGKLFSIDLTDQSGQIRATGFNQECDRYYEMLKEGDVFYIRGGQIKAANRQYSSINNDYELTFSSETVIEPCHEESTDAIPTTLFNFVKFDQLSERPKEGLIDVIGVVDTVSQCETVVSKQTQKEFKKRNIKLIDDSNFAVSLTLWGDDAEKFENSIPSENMHPVVAIRGVKISDYQGLTLSLSHNGKMVLNPDLPRAFILRAWYDNSGAATSFQNLSAGGAMGGGAAGSQFILLAVSEVERMGFGEKPDYFSIKGTISALKRENCMYKACPTTDCNKKLVDMGVDSYRCEKCNREYTNYKWRLMLSAQVTDFSNQVWVTFFEDTAQTILGHNAEEMGDLMKRDEEAYNNILNKALFKTFTFKLRAKTETYNDETRVKYSCVKVDNVKYAEYLRHLEEELKKLKMLPSPF